jgi:hypothetical protein
MADEPAGADGDGGRGEVGGPAGLVGGRLDEEGGVAVERPAGLGEDVGGERPGVQVGGAEGQRIDTIDLGLASRGQGAAGLCEIVGLQNETVRPAGEVR